MHKINLFCFPYAGGSAALYHEWSELLDPSIRLIPVELAGRGRRISEPFYSDIDAAAEDSCRIIRLFSDGLPFALFGHSMGGLLAYLAARKMETSYLAPAAHLFISGKGAPHLQTPGKRTVHTLPDDEFILEVARLGGTPPEVLGSPEMLAFFLPLLRSDFRMAETCILPADIRPVTAPVTVLTGEGDTLSAEQLEEWRLYTHNGCTIRRFSGDHFFIREHVQTIAGLIRQRLAVEPIFKFTSIHEQE